MAVSAARAMALFSAAQLEWIDHLIAGCMAATGPHRILYQPLYLQCLPRQVRPFYWTCTNACDPLTHTLYDNQMTSSPGCMLHHGWVPHPAILTSHYNYPCIASCTTCSTLGTISAKGRQTHRCKPTTGIILLEPLPPCPPWPQQLLPHSQWQSLPPEPWPSFQQPSWSGSITS